MIRLFYTELNDMCYCVSGFFSATALTFRDKLSTRTKFIDKPKRKYKRNEHFMLCLTEKWKASYLLIVFAELYILL